MNIERVVDQIQDLYYTAQDLEAELENYKVRVEIARRMVKDIKKSIEYLENLEKILWELNTPYMRAYACDVADVRKKLEEDLADFRFLR